MADSTRVVINLNDSLSQRQLSEIKSIILSQAKAEHKLIGIPEFYWSNLIIPIVVPIVAFILVLWITDLISKRKLLRELKTKQQFLFTWVGLIKNQVLKQSEIWEKYAIGMKKLEIDKDGLGKLNLHIEKLQLIDSPTLVSIFVTNKKGDEKKKNKLLFDFENHVEFIRRKYDSSESLLESIKGVIGETSTEWNSRLEELETIIHELHDRSSNYINSSPLINQVLLLYSNYTISGEEGMKVFVEKFINEAEPICSKYLNSTSDSKIFEMIRCMKRLKHAYTSNAYHFEIFSKIFQNNSKELIEKYELLVKTKQDLASLKFKSFYFVK